VHYGQRQPVSASRTVFDRLTPPGIVFTKTIIVTEEEHRFLTIEELREQFMLMGPAMLELVGGNTAQVLTLLALAAMQNSQDSVLVVAPADQTVANPCVFTQAMHCAVV